MFSGTLWKPLGEGVCVRRVRQTGAFISRRDSLMVIPTLGAGLMGTWTLVPGAAFHSLALCDERGRERGAASRSPLQNKCTNLRRPADQQPRMIRAAFERWC